MPLGTAYPFGLRQVKLTPFTDQSTETLGTGVVLPAARTLSFTEAEDYEELRGNDKKIASRGLGPSVDWDLEQGGVPLDAIKIVAGGTVTDSGTTPNQIRKFTKKATDSRPYFRAEGRSVSDSGGDVHVVLYRCRATGDIEWEFSDGSWVLTSCSGEAFPSQATATVDALYDIVQNETDVVLS